MRDMKDGHIKLPNPKKRKPNQFYMMFLMESPLNDHFPYDIFENYFNWTMTYRKNSDFYRPYGWIAPKNWTFHYPNRSAQENWSQYPIPSTLEVKIPNIKDKKPVAWLVSNCHTQSQREHYVKVLNEYIKVDTYGGCGTNKCPIQSHTG